MSSLACMSLIFVASHLVTVNIFDITTQKWTISNSEMNHRRSGCSAFCLITMITVLGRFDEKGYVPAGETFHIDHQKWLLFNIDRSWLSYDWGNGDSIVLDSVETCKNVPTDSPTLLHHWIPKINESSNTNPKMKRGRKFALYMNTRRGSKTSRTLHGGSD